ncbi:MAG: 4Fe-4S dicluster domain-containing protein [Thermoanaerobaculia bacterium]
MSKAILYDATQCVGCLECESACAKQNNNPYDESIAKEQKTSEHKFTYVASKPDDKYMRTLCMHCIDPTCVSVCPVTALEKTALGPVTYDAGKCMGCRYCMLACPFNVPKYEWSKKIPIIKKCTMCYDRVAAGGTTACTEACPTGATMFGERDALLAEARKRMAENPGTYVNHIYGEKEVGGTGVLILSSIPVGTFGYPTHYGPEALPPLTGRVLAHIPDVVTVGCAVLGGIYWITHRRDVVAAAEKDKE